MKKNLKYIILFLLLIILISLLLKRNILEFFTKDSLDELPPFPIDVVYTWAGENSTNNARISNNNELKYSIRSVIKYAPWVNKIYILMNPPKVAPSWFNESYKNKNKQ